MPKKEVFITTKDNPFDYFNEFDEWYAYDREKGYNTLDYLARLTRTSDALSDEDNSLEIERAIDEILEYNILGIYKKIERYSDL